MTNGPGRHSRLVAEPSEAGQRLDLFVTARLPEISRSQVQRLIKTGLILVDGHAGKASTPVNAGASVDVSVPPPTPDTPSSEDLPLAILHDDDDLVVVNKPAGMVVHPAPGHQTGTLVNALLHHVRGLSGIGGRARPGIVHRLDRGTSGVMVVAKHDAAHQSLSRQFQDRVVHKIYMALVWGAPSIGEVFDRPIGRDPRDRQKISSRARRTRTALTTVDDVEVLGALSLIQVTIGTGRTHQIRVHLSEAGHPIAGDELYGGTRKRLPPELAAIQRLERPFLHSRRLSFAHPSDGRLVEFEAPLPADLQSVVDTLRRTNDARKVGRGGGPEALGRDASGEESR